MQMVLLGNMVAAVEQLVKKSIMAKGYSYVVRRDYGFAPNPFNGVLTLAACKPVIRKGAQVGDFVIGFSDKYDENKLVFMMKVSEVSTFDQYWNDPRFLCKRPVMNGSLKCKYGDNIYHHDDKGDWVQEDSHHSFENGVVNEDNLKRDTGLTDHVLISYDFFYFGKNAVEIPKRHQVCVYRFIGQKKIKEKDCDALWKYLCSRYPKNELIGFPRQFDSFKRYDGIE